MGFVEDISGKLIISCQAQEGEPLHGASHMAAMAQAARMAGAGGIRAASPADIRAIKQAVELPLLGLWKQEHGPGWARITPGFQAMQEVSGAGADAIAIEATRRPRPDASTLAELVARAARELGKPVVADVSTLEEGLAAASFGVAAVATTMSGYTPESLPRTTPDFDLLAALVARCGVPVILEGHVWEPAQVTEAFRRGAHAVVVGSAITRPQLIARRFVAAALEGASAAAGRTGAVAADRSQGTVAGDRPRPVAIGLDIGGTKILGGLVEAQTGRIIAEYREPTPAGDGPAGIMQALITTARYLAAEADPVAIGVSSAGHVDWETGVVVDGTPNLPGWAGTAIGPELAAATGLPTCCDNDGNAAAFGEAWVGGGKGRDAVVAITLGTGFGAGFYDRGHLLRGSRGGGAEAGHLILHPGGRQCNCGQRGCVEAYVSGTALARQARSRWGEGSGTHELFARAVRGDAEALALLNEFSHDLALTLASLFNLCDPDIVLIGGGLASQGGTFLPQVRMDLAQILTGRRFDIAAVQIAALGEYAGLVGAAGEAMVRFAGQTPPTAGRREAAVPGSTA